MSCQFECGECCGCGCCDCGCGCCNPCSIEISTPPGWNACCGGGLQSCGCDCNGCSSPPWRDNSCRNPFQQPDPRCCPKPICIRCSTADPCLLMRTTGNLPKRDYGRRISQMVKTALAIRKYDRIMHPESSFLYRRYGQLDI